MHHYTMRKRSSIKTKRSSDANKRAFQIMQESTGEAPEPADDGKDPAAVALGRKGGLVGGKARAKSLSKKKRVAIAKKAAKTRWKMAAKKKVT
jgi:hypothetical protein